ncbi:MAG: hypothetical protein AAF502_12965 [Bacteroidota bacterium]
MLIANTLNDALTIYPYLVKSQLNINFNEFSCNNELLLLVFNLDSRLIHSKQLDISEGPVVETSVNVDGQSSGTYQIRVTGSEARGYMATGKVFSFSENAYIHFSLFVSTL